MIKEYLDQRKSKQLNIEEVANVLLYSIIVIMPFIVSSKFFYVYREGKVAYNYIIGICLLAILLIVKHRIKYIEEKLALVFLGTIFISAIFSPYKSAAFLGNVTRDEGFFMFCIYIVLFITSIKYLKVNEKLITIALISANIMAIHGILQFYGIDIISIFFWNKNNNQSFGLIGNRNFFSTYISIFLFIACSLFILKGKFKYYILSLPLFAALITSQTRGGWLGFLSFSLVGLVLIIKQKKLILKGLIIFISYLLIFIILNFTNNIDLVSRGNSIVNDFVEMEASSGSGRIEIWSIGKKMYIDKPILGTGPDTIALRMSDNYSLESTEYLLKNGAFIDKMHNEFLEYAVSCGIFTLISYLLLIGFILKGLFKNISKDINKIGVLFIVGYLVQSFFNISVVMVAPIFWIVLGGIVKISNEDIEL